jgi:hypothetical protein
VNGWSVTAVIVPAIVSVPVWSNGAARNAPRSSLPT